MSDRGDLLQIVVALLTSDTGRPIAVFVLEGNTKDSATVQDAVDRLRSCLAKKLISLQALSNRYLQHRQANYVFSS